MTKWALTFLYSAWVFLLGILVGRGDVPVKFDMERIQKDLMELIREDRECLAEKYDKPLTPDIEVLKDPKDDPRLPFIASESSEKTNAQGLGENDPLPNKTPALTKKEEMPKPSEAVRLSERPEVRLSERPESSKPDGFEKPDDPEKKLTIQVISYRKPEDADEMAEKLTEKGYPAYVTTGEVSGRGLFYRVRIGYFKNRRSAKKMRERLKRDNFETMIMRRMKSE